MDSLQQEAGAYDSQIEERIANGHVPDLRRAPKCEYFYSNSWRHPEYVKLDFGYLFTRINDAIKKNCANAEGRRRKILEIGCGPGYLSLELARAGHAMTGIDLSPKCIEVAKSFAYEDPWREERGSLRYVKVDILETTDLEPGSFDAMVFLGALHHFPDQDAVGRRANNFLAPLGIIVAHEPTRDRITEGMIELGLMIRVLLSAGGGFVEKFPVPVSAADLDQELTKIKKQVEYITDDGSHSQSPHDNEAGYKEMHEMLEDKFDTVFEEDTFSFFHEIIGGLRFDEDTNVALAGYLRDLDSHLVKEGLLAAYEFLHVGRKRANE